MRKKSKLVSLEKNIKTKQRKKPAFIVIEHN